MTTFVMFVTLVALHTIFKLILSPGAKIPEYLYTLPSLVHSEPSKLINSNPSGSSSITNMSETLQSPVFFTVIVNITNSPTFTVFLLAFLVTVMLGDTTCVVLFE